MPTETSRVATPENETELLKFATTGTAEHVEKLVRLWRRADRTCPDSDVPVGCVDRYQVVAHVDAAALEADAESGQATLEVGARVPAGTSRQIACDATRVVMHHAKDGSTLDVGRRTRTVPPALGGRRLRMLAAMGRKV